MNGVTGLWVCTGGRWGGAWAWGSSGSWIPSSSVYCLPAASHRHGSRGSVVGIRQHQLMLSCRHRHVL